MGMYDMVETIIYPEKVQLNVEPVICIRCGRTVPVDNAVKQIRETKWHDWDDPDEDAQGQYKYSESVEWYCCGFVDGFGSLECSQAVVKQGIDAKTESLLIIARERELRKDIREAAVQVLQKKAAYNREVSRLLAEIEHYSQYDDNSPNQIR